MAPKGKPRRVLMELGRRGCKTRVFLERGHALVRVQWTEKGRVVGTQSWPNTLSNREAAKAFAQELEAERSGQRRAEAEPITLRELWEAYVTAEFGHLRPNTQRLYTEYWRRWELFVGRNFACDDVTLEMVDQFRRELERRGLAVSTTRQVIRTAKLVFSWGEGRELIQRNRLHRYRFKVAKEQRVDSPEEYRNEDLRAILAALDPMHGGQWRAFVALSLCGYQGRRQHAVLHLRWEDVDMEAGTVTWRAEWDKMGNEETTPLRRGARQALEVALYHRERSGYTGPWVLPAGSRKNRKSECYSIQSLWSALQKAEERAGIPKLTRRAGHGLRRMLAGNVNELTGDPMLALRTIGDRDMRQAERYLKRRDDRIADAFERLDEAEGFANTQRTRNEGESAEVDASVTADD